MFCNQYIGRYDREDLLDEMKIRTQGTGEKISKYLTSFRYIVSKFNKPPSSRYQVETAYKNLLSIYIKAMSDRAITSLERIEKLGRA